MAEQSSDNEIGETLGMLEQPSNNQIDIILRQARFQFAIKCLTYMNLKKNKNVVLSPYSIYEGLLRVYLASSDDTEKQLRCELELPDNVDMQKIITNLILHTTERRNKNEKLHNYKETHYCWITNTKFVNNMTQRLFKNRLEVVNFRKGYDYLKNWIYEFLKNKTEGCIRMPVQLCNIFKDMEIILSTVLCLEGETIQLGKDWPFSIEESTNSYEMYSLRTPRSFISVNLESIVTEIPFLDKNVSLFLLFPAWHCMGKWFEHYRGISGLVNRLMTKEGTDELSRVLDSEESSQRFLKREKVTYPDFFEVENELKIDELLDKLGIQSLLQDDQATLPHFTNSNLQFGDATHRAYIKVTSEYVTAGAVNMFFTKKEALVNPSKNINHSAGRSKFLWLLYCKENHTILFMGSVNKRKPMSSTVEQKTFCDQMIQMFQFKL